jgi:hypothetical protein
VSLFFDLKFFMLLNLGKPFLFFDFFPGFSLHLLLDHYPLLIQFLMALLCILGGYGISAFTDAVPGGPTFDVRLDG